MQYEQGNVYQSMVDPKNCIRLTGRVKGSLRWEYMYVSGMYSSARGTITEACLSAFWRRVK